MIELDVLRTAPGGTGTGGRREAARRGNEKRRDGDRPGLAPQGAGWHGDGRGASQLRATSHAERPVNLRTAPGAVPEHGFILDARPAGFLRDAPRVVRERGPGVPPNATRDLPGAGRNF